MLLIGCTLLGLSDGFNYPTIKYLVIELNGFFIRNISAFFFWHYGS